VALWSYGFRPFFVLSGTFAVLVVGVWLLILNGDGWRMANPLHWHAHEMLFGVVVASIAGFLLTSVPTWTGTPPTSGGALMALACVWLLARMMLALPAPLMQGALMWTAIVIDLSFIPLLALAIAPPLLRTRSRRNYGILALLGILVVANGASHANWQGISVPFNGHLLAADVVLVLVTIIGGRIIPLFTRNALARRGVQITIPNQRLLGWITLGTSVALLANDLLSEVLAEYAFSVTLLSALAAAAHGLRLAGWKGLLARGQPIVWILHLGYLWIPVALALRALAGFEIDIAHGWLHALTIGAFGTMLIAVMSRVALGHTGREIVAQPVTVAAYLAVTLAGLIRISVYVLPAQYASTTLLASGALWCIAFSLFLWIYVPILFTRRADAGDAA
jgi:uncharacterized protein involved in response to NO